MAAEAKNKHERKVLLAVDYSEHSVRAFEWYIEDLHREGNIVMLVHSLELPGLFIPADAYGTALYNDWLAKAKEVGAESRKLLDKFQDMCAEKNCNCERYLLEGDNPGDAIVKLIKKERPSYVVIGSRGQSMVRRTVMGSVSDYVLHHAHVPVCVSPP